MLQDLKNGVYFGVVYNYPKLKEPLYWPSRLIRSVTCGGNHSVEFDNGIVKEYSSSSFKWRIKRYLGYQVSYAPNKGSGYRETPLEEWVKESSRVVKVYKPTVPLCKVVTIHSGYSYLKLAQISLNTVRKKWFVRGNTWNGRSGLGKFILDLICSEYIAMRLGFSKPYLISPADLEKVKELEWIADIETRKHYS